MASIPLSGLAQDAVPAGFEPIFNGRDLSGWYGMRDVKPAELAKMTDEQPIRSSTQEDIGKHWRVEDGVLVNDGQGLYLTTNKDYGDFELLVEYKTVAQGRQRNLPPRRFPRCRSGIPPTRANGNSAPTRAREGSGTTARARPAKTRSKLMDKPFGEWNQFRIHMIGNRVTVHLNGEKVVDNAVMENYYDRDNPALREGSDPIADARRRNPLAQHLRPRDPPHGRRKESWRGGCRRVRVHQPVQRQGSRRLAGAVDNYEVLDGAIVCKKGKGGSIYSKEEYADFALRFEFKLPPGGNNGLAIRSPGKGRPGVRRRCARLQILDNTRRKIRGCSTPDSTTVRSTGWCPPHAATCGRSASGTTRK